MKHRALKSTVGIMAALPLLLILSAYIVPAGTVEQRAQAEQETEATPQVIVIEMIPTPTPEPPPTSVPTQPPRKPAYHEYEWSASTIDAVASVFWSECNTDAEKLAVAQLIYNRSVDGAPFETTIEAVAMQGSEFNRGHISDKNRDKARTYLNKVMTQALGEWAGIDVPTTALYMRRESGALVMLDSDFNEVWRGES